MKVIRKEPGKHPEVVDIANDLKSLQNSVDGPIETVTLAEDCCLICNEEGLFRGLPFNITFCSINFFGTILMVGVSGEEFTDLDDEVIPFGLSCLTSTDHKVNPHTTN